MKGLPDFGNVYIFYLQTPNYLKGGLIVNMCTVIYRPSATLKIMEKKDNKIYIVIKRVLLV